MAKQLQIRGGTTVQHSTFTGALREITIDTDKDVVVVHDGTTVGGFPLAKQTSVDSKVTKVTSTDNAVVRFNGVTGDVQNSGVVIDDSGNVGIGVTPSAWVDDKAIQLPQGSISSGYEYGLSSVVNAYRTSGNIWKYNVSQAASRYNMTGNVHQWQTAPLGTAGNPITWTNAMTLDASGNLSVGNSILYRSMQSGQNPLSEGTVVFQLYQPIAGNTYFYIVNGSSQNSAATGMGIARHSTTLRSINAAGTINASGADYAEYEYSNNIILVKGQIVGFKADGTLTDKYSESIRFAIKSTNPSIVGGDTWGIEEIVGKRPEKPVKSEEMTDEEFAELEELYELELADFEVRLEVERQKVDRIAYAGKVPVNVYGAVAGQYVIAVEKDGGIDGKLVNKSDMTFSEYQDAVGRVNKILDDGRAEVAVIIH